MIIDKKTIGENIRIKRERKGMTGAELAKESKVTPGMISHIENGRKKPSIDTLASIAAVLMCKIDDLVH